MTVLKAYGYVLNVRKRRKGMGKAEKYCDAKVTPIKYASQDEKEI